MRARLSIVAILALISAFGLAACGSSDDGGSDDLAGFCESYVAFNDTGDKFDEIDQDDVDAGKAALSDSVDALDDLSDNAPDEIADEVNETRDWFQGASDAIADADTISDVEDAGTKYSKDNPQPTDAFSAIDAFAAKNCDGDQPAEGDSGTGTDTTSTDAG